MAYGSLHAMSGAGRRGDSLPGRLRLSARRGVTLVELLISMLILAIVCIAWLQIIGIQSARKEARRREAVERLAGMMDAFLHESRDKGASTGVNYMVRTNANHAIDIVKSTVEISAMFDGDVSPIGYQLRVVNMSQLDNYVEFGSNWGTCKWLVGKLYNRSNCSEADAGKPFFTVPVCLGF